MAFSGRQFASMIRIALFAVLMAVSAPTMSMLLSAACPDNAEHCHPTDDATGKAHHVMKQCGYCVLQADLPGMPPATGLAALLDAPPRFAPDLPTFVPVLTPVRLAPQSRAPPSA